MSCGIADADIEFNKNLLDEDLDSMFLDLYIKTDAQQLIKYQFEYKKNIIKTTKLFEIIINKMVSYLKLVNMYD